MCSCETFGDSILQYSTNIKIWVFFFGLTLMVTLNTVSVTPNMRMRYLSALQACENLSYARPPREPSNVTRQW